MSPFEVVQQAGSAGAIISGVDLRDDIDDVTVGRLRAALAEHLVICLRGQADSTPDQQIAFAVVRWRRRTRDERAPFELVGVWLHKVARVCIKMHVSARARAGGWAPN